MKSKKSNERKNNKIDNVHCCCDSDCLLLDGGDGSKCELRAACDAYSYIVEVESIVEMEKILSDGADESGLVYISYCIDENFEGLNV